MKLDYQSLKISKWFSQNLSKNTSTKKLKRVTVPVTANCQLNIYSDVPLYTGGTMVEHSTHKSEIKSSIPTTGRRRENESGKKYGRKIKFIYNPKLESTNAVYIFSLAVKCHLL